MHRPIIDLYPATLRVEPCERVLHPVLIVTRGEILACMRAAAFLAVMRTLDGHRRLRNQVVEFECLDKIGVPDHRAVLHPDLGHVAVNASHEIAPFLQNILGAEHGAVILHGLLHPAPELGSRNLPLGIPEPVKPRDGIVAGTLRQRRLALAWLDIVSTLQARSPTEHHKVDERVRPEAIGTMHRHARRLANGHQARDDAVRIAVLQRQDFAVIVCRDATHVVVHGRQDRDGLLGDIDAREDARRFRDTRQPLMDDLRVQMAQVQMDMVLVRTAAPPLADLDRHRAADDIA